MLGQLARKSDTCSKSLWRSSWSDVQPSACACLLSFLEVADFAPKVKWNTCSAVQRLLQWGAWDEHTMCIFVVTRAFVLLLRFQFGLPQLKFIADCILLVFSAPLSHPTPTSRSLSHFPIATFSMSHHHFCVPQVVKSACLAARCVPSSAILPRCIKDVASRCAMI